jgi:hypothetical protein
LGIVQTRDFGTDLVSCDKTSAAQVKHYGSNTRVDFADVAKFYTHSSFLRCTERLLCTTPETQLTRIAQNTVDLAGMEVRQASLDVLVADALAQCPGEDVQECSAPWTWRPGQAAAAEAFVTSDKKTYKIQLPCGYGKTAPMGLIVERMKKGARFLILVPWRDFLHQTVGRLQRAERKICTLGDGECTLDETADLVVCTHAHLAMGTLEGTTWDVVFVDEAHHCIETCAGLSWRAWTPIASSNFPPLSPMLWTSRCPCGTLSTRASSPIIASTSSN